MKTVREHYALRRLAAAIVQQAAVDAAQEKQKMCAACARLWLAADSLAADLLEVVGMHQDRVVAWVSTLPALTFELEREEYNVSKGP